MKIIIPMAGQGTRLRPHTLTVPKPLMPIAGKPIVHRLVEDIAKVCPEPVSDIGFIIGDFGKEVQEQLKKIAQAVGAQGHIFYQEEALGTAHAIHCGHPLLEGKTIVAFADTLFKAEFVLQTEHDGIIWVQEVDNPEAFGVVSTDEDQIITGFVEKPQDFVSNMAIIGIYYFKEGRNLKIALESLFEKDIRVGKEYQLTDALELMKNEGTKFVPGRVTEWLDCGNKEAAVYTNMRYLEYIKDQKLVADSALINNSVIIPPVFVGENVELNNTVIGPYVSIGENTVIMDSRIRNTIIQNQSEINNANIANSMLGNFVKFHGTSSNVSIGDYTAVKE